MSGGPPFDVGGIWDLVDLLEDDQVDDPVEQYFDFCGYYGDRPPSHTDDSETSALFTDGGATLVTWPSTVESYPEASSAPQHDSQDEDVRHSNATYAGDSHTTGLIPQYNKSEADIPRPQTLVLPNPPETSSLSPRPLPPLTPGPGIPTNEPFFTPNGRLPPGQPQQKTVARPRTLKCPEETAEIRKKVCCRRCKIHKTKCGVSDACHPCKEWVGEDHKRLCIRKTLEDLLRAGDGYRRWSSASLEHQHFRGASPEENLMPLDVVFSEADIKPLRVYICSYYLGGSRFPGVAPYLSPPREAIIEWATSQAQDKAEAGFQGDVDSFLALYARSGCEVKGPRPLVEKVVTMSAMWRILNAKVLYCRAETQRGIVAIPESIRVHLQRLAQQIMYSVEQDILKDIDGLIPDTVKNREDRPAIWGILWMLILIYRQSLEQCQRRVVVQGGASSWVSLEASQYGSRFAEVTRLVLDSIIVIYSSHFRTRDIQDTLDSPDEWTFRNNPEVRKAFEAARGAVLSLYDHVSKQEQEHDSIILRLIIKEEEKIKKRRRGARESAKKKGWWR